MKTTLLALALSACLIPVAIQANPEHEGRYQQHMLERMDKELSLTDAQRNQVEALLDSQRAKLQILRDETHARLDKILDDGQQAKLEAIKAERKARWQNRFKAHQKHKTVN